MHNFFHTSMKTLNHNYLNTRDPKFGLGLTDTTQVIQSIEMMAQHNNNF